MAFVSLFLCNDANEPNLGHWRWIFSLLFHFFFDKNFSEEKWKNESEISLAVDVLKCWDDWTRKAVVELAVRSKLKLNNF